MLLSVYPFNLTIEQIWVIIGIILAIILLMKFVVVPILVVVLNRKTKRGLKRINQTLAELNRSNPELAKQFNNEDLLGNKKQSRK